MGALCRYAAGLWSGDIPSTFAELAIQVEKRTIFAAKKEKKLILGENSSRGDDEWSGSLDH